MVVVWGILIVELSPKVAPTRLAHLLAGVGHQELWEATHNELQLSPPCPISVAFENFCKERVCRAPAGEPPRPTPDVDAA